MSEKIEGTEVEFSSVVGIHKLSGVDETQYKFHYRDDSFEDANMISFVLDGVTYSALEDPDDGYRSSMDRLIKSNVQISNVFRPVEVSVSSEITSQGRHGKCEILKFIDIQNGKIVLEVGTENSDDYYPSFVASWTPENLSINSESTATPSSAD